MNGQRKLALRGTLLAAGFSILAAEAGLRVFYPLADPFPRQRRIEIGAYVPNRHEPRFTLRILPEEGLPGIDGERRFETNADGYLGPDLAQTSTTVPRVFLVGGSTMEGVALGNAKNPATLIASKLEGSGVQSCVLNTGHSGDATFDHIAVVGHRIAHESPRVVVFLVGINDLIAIARGEEYDHRQPDQTIQLSTAAMLRLQLTHFHVGRLIFAALGRARLRQWDESRPSIETHYRRAANRCLQQPLAKNPPDLDLAGFERNLRQLVAMTRSVGARPILVTQPNSWSTPASEPWWWMRCFGGHRYSPEQMSRALDMINARTMLVAQLEGVDLVDAAANLDGRHMYDDVHFNDAGAELLSTSLATAIRRALLEQ